MIPFVNPHSDNFPSDVAFEMERDPFVYHGQWLTPDGYTLPTMKRFQTSRKKADS